VQIATCDTSTDDLERRLEPHRSALVAHCRRMLGSGFEADDAVQETMVRAWRAYDGLEDRSSLLPWLYRIATNVCFDMTKARQRRAAPPTPRPGPPADGGRRPGRQAVEREDVRLAFVAALAAPAAQAALGAAAVRGAALAGRRGGRAARHQRGLGQQRPPAGPAPRWPSTTARSAGSPPDRRHAGPRAAAPGRRLRALRPAAFVALLR
jgi:DNA-directed RNA polymerase specialized sigma24 family protein